METGRGAHRCALNRDVWCGAHSGKEEDEGFTSPVACTLIRFKRSNRRCSGSFGPGLIAAVWIARCNAEKVRL